MAGRQSLESRMAAQRWSLQSALSAHEYVCIPRWAGMRLGGRHIPPPQGIRLDKKSRRIRRLFFKTVTGGGNQNGSFQLRPKDTLANLPPSSICHKEMRHQVPMSLRFDRTCPQTRRNISDHRSIVLLPTSNKVRMSRFGPSDIGLRLLSRPRRSPFLNAERLNDFGCFMTNTLSTPTSPRVL